MAGNKPRVLITHCGVPEDGLQLLSTKCELVIVPGDDPSAEDIIKLAPGVDAIMWATKHKLNQQVVDAAGPTLRCVSTMSAGYDNVDVPLLWAHGILVGNTPSVLSDAVAEIGVALLLTASRRLQEGRRIMEEGTWNTVNPTWNLGKDVVGSTVGIVGLGGIGQAFAKRISAFNIGRLLYCGHRPKPEAKALRAEFVSFDELLKQSDFVLAACPLNDETKNLFNAQAFQTMKPTSIFINVGRGGCVDQDALVDALKTGQIWAAALDVMIPEPLPPDHPLMSLPNCVLFPHRGSATEGTRSAMAHLAAQNILNALAGDPMEAPILEKKL